MKGYRYLVPAAFIALMVLSWYQLITGIQAAKNEYEMALKNARSFAEKEILTEAVENYNKALSMKESIELYQEISEFYHKYGTMDEQISWDLLFSEKYPETAEAYLPLLCDYYEQKEYGKCFQVYDTVVKRSEPIKEIEELMEPLEYEYFYKDNTYGEVSSFCSGFCAVKNGEQWGYIDETGSQKIGASYQYTAPFCGELAPVITMEGESYFINKEGDKMQVMPEGLTVVSLGGLFSERFSVFNGKNYACYDSKGNCLFDGFDYIGLFTYGRALVKKDGNWKLIDVDGNQISEMQYEDAYVDGIGRTFQSERAFVKNGEGWIMIDTEGNQIGSTVFEDVRLFAEESSKAAVKSNGKWCYLDVDGNQVLEVDFEDAHSFSNGLAAVEENGFWGYIDQKGNMVIDSVFQEAGEFNRSKNAMVKQDDVWYMISLYKYNH